MNFQILKPFFSLIALIIICLSSCYTKQFCEEFVKNGNKIDFVFRRMVVGEKFAYPTEDSKLLDLYFARILINNKMKYFPIFDLFINGHYWRLRMGDPALGLFLLFENKTRGYSEEGRDAPFFNGYRMAADIPNMNLDFANSKAVLFSNTSVMFGHIVKPLGRDMQLDKYEEYLPDVWFENKLALPFDSENPRLDFAFAPIPNMSFVHIDFASKYVTTPTPDNPVAKYRLSFSRFSLLRGFSSSTDKFRKVVIPNDQYTVFKNWTTPYNIIGVTTMPDTFLDLTLMILMADEKRVVFCMTLHNYTSDYCRKPVEIVDCSYYIPGPNPPLVTNGTGEKSNQNQKEQSGSKGWTWFLLAFIAVVAIIIIVALIIFSSKPEPKSEKSAKNSDNADKSKASTEITKVKSTQVGQPSPVFDTKGPVAAPVSAPGTQTVQN